MGRSKINWILVVGDLLVLLSFVVIGRNSHALSPADLAGGVLTALPFVLSWFMIAPWFGLYKTNINRSFKRMLPRLAATWMLAVPLAHILRALLLGRAIPAGIPLTFVLVSLGYIGVVMVLWRAGYSWWQQRQLGEMAS